MTRYASQTTVSSEKSRNEIERTLQRYGATAFSYGWEDDPDTGGTQAMIAFQVEGFRIRLLVTMPLKGDREFTHTKSRGWLREPAAALEEWEKGCRQRWRALALLVKAKLEAVESDITTVEEEFLPHIILPDGRSVATVALPEIRKAYENGRMPPMLLPSSAGPDAYEDHARDAVDVPVVVAGGRER